MSSLSRDRMPLTVLARRLTLEPPSIETLVGLIAQSEAWIEFLGLIREYLPEHEREIMANRMGERIMAFHHLFGKQYFPLAEFAFGEEEELEYLVRSIPVELAGWEYDSYHEFDNFRPGHVLLLGLVINPFDHDFGDTEGARIPILDECKEIVGPELVARIPARGWDPDVLRTACDDTPYEGVADFAEWLSASTGLWVMDATYEMYGEEIWDREIVDELTRQHPLVRARFDRIGSMGEWLEANPAKNYAELLDHLVPKLSAVGPKIPKTLIEVFADEAAAKVEAEAAQGCHIGRMMHRPGM